GGGVVVSQRAAGAANDVAKFAAAGRAIRDRRVSQRAGTRGELVAVNLQRRGREAASIHRAVYPIHPALEPARSVLALSHRTHARPGPNDGPLRRAFYLLHARPAFRSPAVRRDRLGDRCRVRRRRKLLHSPTPALQSTARLYAARLRDQQAMGLEAQREPSNQHRPGSRRSDDLQSRLTRLFGKRLLRHGDPVLRDGVYAQPPQPRTAAAEKHHLRILRIRPHGLLTPGSARAVPRRFGTLVRRSAPPLVDARRHTARVILSGALRSEAQSKDGATRYRCF